VNEGKADEIQVKGIRDTNTQIRTGPEEGCRREG